MNFHLTLNPEKKSNEIFLEKLKKTLCSFWAHFVQFGAAMSFLELVPCKSKHQEKKPHKTNKHILRKTKLKDR